MGNAYIMISALLRELGVEPVVPPMVSQRTIALGTKVAPEFSCFPLKVNLGNFQEAIELGAEAILMAGGVGPCRFGYYGEMQREVLKELGYEIEFLMLEAPKTHPRELWEQLKKIFPRHRPQDLKRAISLAWIKAKAIDSFDKIANQVRAIEKIPGTTDYLQQNYYQKIDRTDLIGEIKRYQADGMAELKAIPVQADFEPLRIMMLGEIYMVLEPRVNFQLERMLGRMGVVVTRTTYLTDWIYYELLMSIFKPDWRKGMIKLAKPYLKSGFVGGHGLETVAHTVEAGVNNYHGVVQLAPFTCMPEIVAMQVLPAVVKDLEIPVLSIIIDEHSGEAGIQTRLEAFIDLLRYRHQKAGGRKDEVVSGS